MFEFIGKAVAGIVSVAVIGAAAAFLNGSILMLGIGAAHGWIPAIPTAGYWSCVLIAYATRLMFAVQASSGSK